MKIFWWSFFEIHQMFRPLSFVRLRCGQKCRQHLIFGDLEAYELEIFFASACILWRNCVTSSSILTICRSFYKDSRISIKYLFISKAYINGVSRSLLPKPDSIPGYAQHRRESGKPTESMSPPGELVFQVFHWRKLHQIEDEDALVSDGNKKKFIMWNLMNSQSKCMAL